MSDSFLYSSDDAAMMSELQHWHSAVGQGSSGVGSESKAGLSVGTSTALAPECGLTFLQKSMC